MMRPQTIEEVEAIERVLRKEYSAMEKRHRNEIQAHDKKWHDLWHDRFRIQAQDAKK